MKKILSILLVIIIATTCIGCGGKIGGKVIRNDSFLSENEYRDMRQAEQQNRIKTKRNIKPRIIEIYEVKEELGQMLVNRTQDILSQYKVSDGYSNEVGNTHEYLKLNIDNITLTGNPTYTVGTSDGFYYVTATWKTKYNDTVAEMKQTANYIGINGAIGINSQGQVQVDDQYLSQLVEEVNAKRSLLDNKDLLDTNISEIKYESKTEEIVEKIKSTASETEEIMTEISNIRGRTKKTEEPVKEVKKEKPKDDARVIRRLAYNSYEFNKVGSIRNMMPVVPNALALFELTDDGEELSGYNLYREGDTFEKVRNGGGNIKIVFVYKHNLDTDTYDYYTMYFEDYESANKLANNGETIPDYIKTELGKSIERISREYANKDVAALVNGEMIYPQDLGIKLLLQRDATEVTDHELYIKDYISRDNNKYVVELEQIVSEQPKGVKASTAKYLRKYYALMELEETQYVLKDLFLHEMKLLRMPEVETDKGSKMKLFSAKSISNNIPDSTKDEIREELRKFSIGMENKKKTDSFDEEGNIVIKNNVEQWGAFDRLNSDTSIMNDKMRTSYQNELYDRMMKYGGVKIKVLMKVAEWIAGNEDQVEVITNELIDYGTDGVFVNRYIVFSKFKNKWVIDEMSVKEEKQLKKSEVKAYRTELGE